MGRANSSAMRLLAPAKINLHLRVGPRRADGFHPLLSWFVTVGLFDTLVLQAAASEARGEAPWPIRAGDSRDGADAGAAGEIALDCDLPGLPCDERNLVVKIARAFQDAARSHSSALRADRSQPAARHGAPRHVGGFRATLHKRIPIGAGLGGGSSDAARTLMGLNRLWRTGWSPDQLSAFAARFGSDLPFFLHGPNSVCRGRGEIVSPLPRLQSRWAVLVLPALAMPTADVYRRFDAMGFGREYDIADQPDWQSWATLRSEDLLPRLVNDLEPPAFDLAPNLGRLRARIEEKLGRAVRMSGSGSSLFTLFDSEPAARDAAEHIERDSRERALAVEVCPIFRDDLNEDFGDR